MSRLPSVRVRSVLPPALTRAEPHRVAQSLGRHEGDPPLRRSTYEAVVLQFERALVSIDVEYRALVSALDRRSLAGVAIAACDLASACLSAEAVEVQILSHSSAVGEPARFARSAMRVSNYMVADLFGRALAQTSCWRANASQLRGLLRQLSTRIDVRSRPVRHPRWHPANTARRRAGASVRP